MTLIDLARNYGEHNAVIAGRAAGGLRDHDGRRLAILRRIAPLQLLNSGRQASISHHYEHRDILWRNFASRFYQKPGPVNFVFDKPRGLYLSLRCARVPFVVGEVVVVMGPFRVDGLNSSGNTRHRSASRESSSEVFGKNQLYSAAAYTFMDRACSIIFLSCLCGLARLPALF
jgi:hypothetical protein